MSGFGTDYATGYATSYGDGSSPYAPASAGSGYATAYGCDFATPYAPGGPTGPPARKTFFELDLVGYLSSSFGLTCYPGHIPQGASLPALGFVLLRAARENGLAGGNGIAEAHYQLTVSSTDYFDVGAISDDLERLHGYRGPMGSSYVSPALLENEVTLYEPAADGSDLGVHSKALEFTFYYRRP